MRRFFHFLMHDWQGPLVAKNGDAVFRCTVCRRDIVMRAHWYKGQRPSRWRTWVGFVGRGGM